MMRKHFNSRFYLLLVLVFLIFIFLFIEFKEHIESFNKILFSLTGEVIIERKAQEYPTEHIAPQTAQTKKTEPAKTAAKQNEPPKPAQPVYNPATAKKLDAPKTPEPIILFLEREPDFMKDNIPDFPEIRKETGENWDKEKTRIRMTCDGRYLYVNVVCFDSDKASLVTEYSKNEGSNSAWKDDSVELFLMKDPQADHYCQYVASASGKTHFFYVRPGNTPFEFAIQPNVPQGFQLPIIESVIVPHGFEVDMRIPLSNINLENVKPKQKIFMQVVRNYRGEHKDGVNLQLFPCYIYADMNIPPSNHDRRAYLPVTIQKSP